MLAKSVQEPAPAQANPAQTFYRRPLPQQLIAFSSVEGRQIFREALDAGGMESYFALSEQFHTQSDPGFCGLGTLTMCLNALNLDPQRQWRGVWRWFSEELLDCCVPLETARTAGITLEEFVCLARCNGAAADAHFAMDTDINHFRRVIEEACTKPGVALVSAFARGTLGQTGVGHYSPIGGYHKGRDLVLVMDVARFKYPPYWCSVPLLWEAMGVLDPVTARSRGFVLLSSSHKPLPTLWRLNTARSWSEITKPLMETIPRIMATSGPQLTSPMALLQVLLHSIPMEVLTMLTTWHEQLGRASVAPEHCALIEQLLAETRGIQLYKMISEAWPEGTEKEMVTIVMLILPRVVFKFAPQSVVDELQAVRSDSSLPSALRAEVAALRNQLHFVSECFQCGGGRCGSCASDPLKKVQEPTVVHAFDATAAAPLAREDVAN